MAWLAWVVDRGFGRKARLAFVDSGPATDGRRWPAQPVEDETVDDPVTTTVDIDLPMADPPVDFFSSSFDLMRGLTVIEMPLDAVSVAVRNELRQEASAFFLEIA